MHMDDSFEITNLVFGVATRGGGGGVRGRLQLLPARATNALGRARQARLPAEAKMLLPQMASMRTQRTDYVKKRGIIIT